jgi:hypothetical protein
MKHLVFVVLAIALVVEAVLFVEIEFGSGALQADFS